MPSIYPNLRFSDRKFIRTEKARIRRQFLDAVKQKEMISELYERMLPKAKEAVKVAVAPKIVKEVKPESKKVEVKKIVKAKSK